VRNLDPAVAQVTDAYRTVHILVNNAGSYFLSPPGGTTEATFDAMIDINLKGVFFLCQSVLPVFERQGHGKIINVGSIFGHDGLSGIGGLLQYQRVQSCC
jgi:3-oxoacyl-[acyl-carrier protein] reductase